MKPDGSASMRKKSLQKKRSDLVEQPNNQTKKHTQKLQAQSKATGYQMELGPITKFFRKVLP